MGVAPDPKAPSFWFSCGRLCAVLVLCEATTRSGKKKRSMGAVMGRGVVSHCPHCPMLVCSAASAITLVITHRLGFAGERLANSSCNTHRGRRVSPQNNHPWTEMWRDNSPAQLPARRHQQNEAHIASTQRAHANHLSKLW